MLKRAGHVVDMWRDGVGEKEWKLKWEKSIQLPWNNPKQLWRLEPGPMHMHFDLRCINGEPVAY